MSKSEWIKKLRKLDPPPKNKYDKGGRTLLACMEYYNVVSLAKLTEEQLKLYYEKVTNNGNN